MARLMRRRSAATGWLLLASYYRHLGLRLYASLGIIERDIGAEQCHHAIKGSIQFVICWLVRSASSKPKALPISLQETDRER